MNAMIADAGNPFAQSEMQMSERMMAAVGTDVGDTWVRKMIEHHQGAIDMSQIVLKQNPRADVAEMARMTVEKQGKEIEDLRKLVKQGSPNAQSGELYRPAMTQMHDAMMAAKVAMATSGRSAQRGARWKKGFSTAAGFWRISAPCPK